MLQSPSGVLLSDLWGGTSGMGPATLQSLTWHTIPWLSWAIHVPPPSI